MDERLAPKHQVVYTTHSPFMVDLDRLGSVRTVQDMDDRGTVVTDDVMDHDAETVFPLQVAMGYRLAQSLFLAPYCLLVNSPSTRYTFRFSARWRPPRAAPPWTRAGSRYRWAGRTTLRLTCRSWGTATPTSRS